MTEKARKSRSETADALRKAAEGGAVVEWSDRDEGYAPPKTVQLNLTGTTLRKKPKAKELTLTDFQSGILLIGAVAAIGGVAMMIYGQRQAQTAYPYSGEERASPGDWLPYGIQVPGTKEIRIADTNSMDPVIDSGNVALGETVASPEQLGVGDIITYWDDETLIIHRLISQGMDQQGWWGITKGDNNEIADEPIRFEQIDSVVVGILY